MAQEMKIRCLDGLLGGKRTPEKVKSILKICHRKATNWQINYWCHRAGRWPLTPEKLADIITGKA